MTREERIRKSWGPYLADIVRKQGSVNAELWDDTSSWEREITDTAESITFVGERKFWHDSDTNQTTRWYDVTCEGLYIAKVYY